MNINILGRHMNLYSTVRNYVEAKVAKLERFNDQIQRIDVTLSKTGDEKVIDMVIKLRHGGQVVGREKQAEFFAATDLLVDKMSRQLKKQNERLKVNRHRGERLTFVEQPDSDEENLESYQEIIERTPF